MKKFRIIVIAMALVLSVATTIFAVSKFANKTVAQSGAASCCNDASCCAGGTCKMGGACCGSADACPLNKQKTEKANFAGVPVEDATSQSCHRNDAQEKASTATKNCCAGGGSACCGNGGGSSCCKSKTRASL